MKKFPIDIEADGLILETLGLYDVQALDGFVKRWHLHMRDPFVARLVDAYETDGTLEPYTFTSFYHHKTKKTAEYVITQQSDEGEKQIAGYFKLQVRKDVGETFIWVAPTFRNNHLFSRTFQAVQESFFKAGLEKIQTQCYFKNPYFKAVCHVMDKYNHQPIKEGSASVTWEKTADMWRAEKERISAETPCLDKETAPIYEDEIRAGNLTLKVFDPISKNVVTLLKFAKSAFDEKGYRPACLNVGCMKSALFALQSADKLKKEQKFCEYFLHVDDQLVGIIALREERFNESDAHLPSLDRGRKASCLYWTHRAFRGNGYMTDALKAAAASFFAHGGSLLELDIYPDNTASMKVAQKVGFKFDSCGRYYLTRADFNTSIAVANRKKDTIKCDAIGQTVCGAAERTADVLKVYQKGAHRAARS